MGQLTCPCCDAQLVIMEEEPEGSDDTLTALADSVIEDIEGRETPPGDADDLRPYNDPARW